MHKHVTILSISLSFVLLPTIATAQSWQYSTRIAIDGLAGGSENPLPGTPFFPLVDGATRIGLWIQASVSQTSGTNYGIATLGNGPASAPNNVSTLTTTDFASYNPRLRRGLASSPAVGRYGRAAPFHRTGVSTPQSLSETQNPIGSGPFPNLTNAENGVFNDNFTQLHGINAALPTLEQIPEDPESGEFINPYPVRAFDNQFSSWQNLYRFYIDLDRPAVITGFSVGVKVEFRGFIAGTLGSTYDPISTDFNLLTAPLQRISAETFLPLAIPSPSAAAALALASLITTRRRRVAN